MQIDWWTLGLQTVNFLIVMWLLSRFLYQPVRRMIESREASDRAAADDAEARAREAEGVRQDYEAKRAALEEEMQRREAKLHASIAEKRDAELLAARAEAERTRAEARARIEQEEETAFEELKIRIAGLAEALAAKAVEGRAIDPNTDLETLRRMLLALPADERTGLIADLRQGHRGLYVAVAAPLPEGIQEQWRKALSRELGSGIEVIFEEDPSLIGGAELRFPHAVLSASVADRLRRAADGIRS